MSAVFTVEVDNSGRWEATCCDPRCGYFPHTLAEGPTRRVAERAATIHRKLLATMPDEAAAVPKPSCCEACGQSRTAITELQNLVRQLEQQIADTTGGELR